jgi:amphi-Trp domain-containing protein
MSGKNIIFQSKEITTRKEVAEILLQIAKKLETGSINLIQNDDTITINIPENVEIEIEVKSKEKKTVTKKQLEIEIEWKEGEKVSGALEIE